ncbi:MAG: DUF5362 domain-containing protein [Bacteroidales bacterium]|nr:DUF5362 domain-containing protein [Bacteroidales bacterium]
MEENYQLIDDVVQESEGLQLNQQSKIFLNETRKWAKFLSVFLFIISALMSIGGIIAAVSVNQLSGQSSDQNDTQYIILIMVLFTLLYIIPAVYLFRFAKYMKISLYQNDNLNLENAFRNLKSHYKFIGISVIAAITVYILFFLIMAARIPMGV